MLRRLAERAGRLREPAFVFPLLTFAVLVLIRPGCRPPFGDEISTAVMTRGSLADVIGAAAGDVHPPFYFLCAKALRIAAGESITALRLMSGVFALGAFAFFWPVARRFFGQSAALPSWLLATSSFVIFAARFARYYSLAMLETAAATYVLLLLLERPSRRLWVAYGGLMVLAIYTFYLSVIVMAAHAVVFLVAWWRQPRRFIAPLAVVVAIGLAFAPWVGTLGRQVGRIGAQQAPAAVLDRLEATGAQIGYTLYAFVAGDSISPFAMPLSLAVSAFYGLLAGLGVVRVWRARTARRHVVLAMVGLGLLVPALMRMLGWIPAPFIFVPVRLLFVAPFFVMIVACGLISIGDVRVRRAAFATAVAVQAISLCNYYTGRQWTNWAYVVPMAEIVGYVEENAGNGDLVILDEWNLYRGPYYYWKGEAAVWRFGRSSRRWPARLKSARRVWIIRAVRDTSPGGQVEQLLDYLKANFVLDLQASRRYVSEPAAIYARKRRFARRKVFRHKVECLLFVRPERMVRNERDEPLSDSEGEAR